VGQAVPMGEVPDPQVPEKAKRRTYPAKYKRDILAEYEACDRTDDYFPAPASLKACA